MNSVTPLQILDEAVSISNSTYTLDKGMNSTILFSSTLSKVMV